jgi:hypothetical protein
LRYNLIPQALHTTLTNSVSRATQDIDCDWAQKARSYEMPAPFTRISVPQDRGIVVPSGKGAAATGLVTCAAAIYIYTRGGQVLGTACFHAFSGNINAAQSAVAAVFNVHGTPPDDIHVVFASSLSSNPHSADMFEHSSDGVFQLLADNIPLANMRFLINAGFEFGCNSAGDVGGSPVFNGKEIKRRLRGAAADARRDYVWQFAPGTRTMGSIFSGTKHDKTSGENRAAALIRSIDGSDGAGAIRGVRDFLRGPNSFKDGSLKLFLVRQLLRWTDDDAIALPTNAQVLGEGTLRFYERGGQPI